MEIWKQIQGFKPIYEVSNMGRVRSLERKTNCNGGLFQRKERILKNTIDRNGYHFVFLYPINGRKRTIPVHRLVAMAFIPNPDNKPEIDHIDGNKSNNNPINLRWVTHQENCANPNTVKKLRQHIGENANHKKSICAYTLDGKLVGMWPTITMAAIETQTCRHSISYAANGKYKSANNLIWKYNG